MTRSASACAMMRTASALFFSSSSMAWSGSQSREANGYIPRARASRMRPTGKHLEWEPVA
eukprot:5880537-Pyramimonas_sp.AAC.1